MPTCKRLLFLKFGYAVLNFPDASFLRRAKKSPRKLNAIAAKTAATALPMIVPIIVIMISSPEKKAAGYPNRRHAEDDR